MSVLKILTITYYSFFCPGCHHLHSFAVCDDNSLWSFNGNINLPSFEPSLLNRELEKNPVTNILNVEKYRCHLFLKNGKIIFQTDCTHSLAGKTIDLPEIL